MEKVILVKIVILLTVSLNAKCQNWKLEDCIRYARNHRNEVKKSDLQSKYNAKSSQFAKYEMLPSVGLNLNCRITFADFRLISFADFRRSEVTDYTRPKNSIVFSPLRGFEKSADFLLYFYISNSFFIFETE